ncbi:MAG: hypothetical protein ACI9S8_002512 [Chlamydiales bacterium]|jgi:hypothetical protein
MSSSVSRAFGVSVYKSIHTDEDEFDLPSPRVENDCRETRARAYSFNPNFTDFNGVTKNIFQKSQAYIDTRRIDPKKDYLLRAGENYYLGTKEKVDAFFSTWEANREIDASSVARVPEMGLIKISRPTIKKTCVELTDRIQVCPGSMSNKAQKVYEKHMLQISMTMEGYLGICPESGKKRVEIKLREITSAIKKSDRKKNGSYVVFQDKLSISLIQDNPLLYLTYRFPEDKFDHATHDYTNQKDTGITANLDMGVGGQTAGTGTVGLGYSQNTTRSHAVGLELDDFQGYIQGNEGWFFKLKQVNNKKEGKVPYIGSSSGEIKDSLLKRRSPWEIFTSWSKSKIGILALPEQATETLRIPECVKKWECDLDFNERVKFSVRIKQHVKFLDSHKLNSYTYDFEVPFYLDCAKFKFEHEIEPKYNRLIGLSKKEEDELKQCYREGGPDFKNISCKSLTKVLNFVQRNGIAIRALDLRPFAKNLKYSNLEKIIDHCASLETLYLNGCKNLNDLDVFVDNKKLKRLEIPETSSLKYIGVLWLPEGLEVLNLSNCVNLQDIESLKKAENLKELDLRGCLKLSTEQVEELRQALPEAAILWLDDSVEE